MKKEIKIGILASVTAAMMFAGCGTKEEKGEVPTPTVEVTMAPTEEAEPIVTLGQYKGLTLYEVDSSVIAEELHTMMTEYAELVVVDRAAKEGDTVNINYVGKIDGVAFEGGTDDSEAGTDLALGSGQFIDGFEEGLVGAVAGEVRDLNLTFPEDYGKTELAGQKAVFTVTVNEVKESVVPELTDEFAKEHLTHDTVAEYVTALYAVRNEESFYNQISEHLMDSCVVENYPAEVIAAEKQSMIDYYTSYAEYMGSMFGMDAESTLLMMFGFESMEMFDQYCEEYAYNVVKNMLVLTEIALVEKLELTEEEYQKRAALYASSYEYEDVTSFETDYGKEAVYEAVMMDFVMDYIISQSTIVEAENDAVIQEAQ